MDMLPRTRTQFILMFAGLPVLAVALHLMFCRWEYKATVGQIGRSNYVRMPLLTYTHEVLASRPIVNQTRTTAVNTPVAWSLSGLFARHSPESAKVSGIIVPALLMGATLYLFKAWRYDHRRRTGKCTACGYDMNAQSPQRRRCPECGQPEA